jgi:pimeloyl-ACP methyl ester carboxylesterase
MELNAVELGSGPPLVLLHGLFGSARNFGAVQKRLAAHRRVLALDLRNHGASPHAPGMQYGEQAADVLETLGWRDALPAALVGHSMGGKVAMRLALQSPDAVSRLVVCDIAPVPYPPHFRDYARAMMDLNLTPGLTRAVADAALAASVSDPAVRAFLLQNLSLGPRPQWRIGLAEIAAALPEIEGWDAPAGARYADPVLVLTGDRSDYVRPEHRPAIRALFPAARFVTLKDAGHWLHADQPEAFVSAVDTFVSG